MIAQPKILIIGNGFDLQHKMPTSYSDFANHYIETKIIPEIEKIVVNLARRNEFLNSLFVGNLVETRKKNRHHDSFINKVYMDIASGQSASAAQYLKDNTDKLDTVIANSFLGKLYKSGYDNWFDIERAYFHELLIHKETAQKGNRPAAKKGLLKLNMEFDEIKKALVEYLKTIPIAKDPKVQRFFDTHVRGVKDVYILNFNYTSTIEDYLLEYRARQDIEVNYIHGSLENNWIVFGYGDDTDEIYQIMRDLEIDELIENYKNQAYSKYDNYSQLYERALNKYSDYDVLVIGHSLGKTDKALLSEIINSSKLGKLYCFKRKDLAHTPELVEKEFDVLNKMASRIFSNELDKRIKMNPLSKSSFFP